MAAAPAPYSVNRGGPLPPHDAHGSYASSTGSTSIERLADSLAAVEVTTKERLDLLLRQQTHPKLDYPAILGDVFASKEDMAAVRRMSPADLRKFFRRCQLTCRDPYIQPHVLTILQHHIGLLQQETQTTLPLEITPSELLAQSKIPLAQGGSSLVWRGTWLGGAKVAVKKLRVPWGSDEIKALRKEVGVMRQLDHRHIVPLWGFNYAGWEEEGNDEREENQRRPFLVVPWMENGTACAYLKSMPDGNRMKIIEEISSALSYLHQAGVVHGDLKGDNILIDGAATAFLSDFGNCVVTEDVLSLEPAGETFLGAVRWSSPQVLRGGPKTESGDVFAFGMTMLELMTDLPPYAPELHTDVLVNKAIQSGQRPSRPSKKLSVRGLDDGLWRLMDRLWAHEARRRPNGGEVREEMRVLRAAFERASSASRMADANMLKRTGGVERSLVPAARSSKTSSSRGSTSAQTLSSTSSADGAFPPTPGGARFESMPAAPHAADSGRRKKGSVFGLGRSSDRSML